MDKLRYFCLLAILTDWQKYCGFLKGTIIADQ